MNKISAISGGIVLAASLAANVYFLTRNSSSPSIPAPSPEPAKIEAPTANQPQAKTADT